MHLLATIYLLYFIVANYVTSQNLTSVCRFVSLPIITTTVVVEAWYFWQGSPWNPIKERISSTKIRNFRLKGGD